MSNQPHPVAKLTKRQIAGIITDVAMRFRTARQPYIGLDAFRIGDTYYEIDALSQDGVLYWRLSAGDRKPQVVGGGWLMFVTRPRQLLTAVRAAIQAPHSGQGIYPRVLRLLREHYKRPLRSSMTLSARNIAAWSKVGLYDPSAGRFRINPPSIDAQIAQAWLATEGRLP